MSSPFPLEEQSASDKLYSGPVSDPWHGPTKPGFFTGLGLSDDTPSLLPLNPVQKALGGIGYRVLEAFGSGAAKGEQALGDLLHQSNDVDLSVDEQGGLIGTEGRERSETEGLNPLADAITADAKARVQTMTPSPATTGTAVQIIHSVGEGAYLASTGALVGGLPGAATLTGGVEASAKYHELIEQGVSPTAATESAALTAVTSGAGVLIPGGFGSTLAAKLFTGASTQVGLGLASRYADHQILEANGYPEMAAQQKVWDSTQVLTDALLGMAFGGLAHLHGPEAKAIEAAAKEPGMVDAALVANLAAHDRAAAPGVAIDPAGTHAHQEALDTATTQLLKGEPIDVSQTGVEQARFLSRQVGELQRLAEVHASIAEQLSLQREQLVSDSASFLRGNDTRAAVRELEQHEAARADAQGAYEAVPEPKAAAELKPEILARMEAEDKKIHGDEWNNKSITKLRQKAATQEAKETADSAQQDFLQQKADAQGAVDDVDERVARQRNEVSRLTQAEESFKALRSHDTAVREAGDDQAKLAQVIRNEQDRRALQDQLKPIEPTEANLAEHIAKNPEAAVGGYLNTDTGQVHLDDQTETRPFRFPERNLGQAHGDDTRPAEGATAGSAAAGEPRGAGAPSQPIGTSAKPGAERTLGESRLADTVRTALRERPDLKVPGEDGKPTPAAELLRQAQEGATKEISDFHNAVMAAISCFGRRGA